LLRGFLHLWGDFSGKKWIQSSRLDWFRYFLALTTAVFWGALPIAMKQLLEVMEPFTIVWYRSMMAAPGLGIILASRCQWPSLKLLCQRRWLVLLIIATCGLLGNFIFFSSSLQYLSPTASQVIGQLSPVGMMVASVLI
jgi:drug/metabolite transporter (DMT)-like permease